jgi:hypothetical protein
VGFAIVVDIELLLQSPNWDDIIIIKNIVIHVKYSSSLLLKEMMIIIVIITGVFVVEINSGQDQGIRNSE